MCIQRAAPTRSGKTDSVTPSIKYNGLIVSIVSLNLYFERRKIGTTKIDSWTAISLGVAAVISGGTIYNSTCKDPSDDKQSLVAGTLLY